MTDVIWSLDILGRWLGSLGSALELSESNVEVRAYGTVLEGSYQLGMVSAASNDKHFKQIAVKERLRLSQNPKCQGQQVLVGWVQMSSDNCKRPQLFLSFCSAMLGTHYWLYASLPQNDCCSSRHHDLKPEQASAVLSGQREACLCCSHLSSVCQGCHSKGPQTGGLK